MATVSTFQISRADGRSNQQVLIDYVNAHPPGRFYPYNELVKVLSSGAAQPFSIERTRAVVLQSQRRLLRESQRALMNVRGQGYRLAEAARHQELARKHERKSEVQLRKGLHLLKHVRWDEMDENSRQAHQGLMMIVESLHQRQSSLSRRQSAVEELLSSIMQGRSKDN